MKIYAYYLTRYNWAEKPIDHHAFTGDENLQTKRLSNTGVCVIAIKLKSKLQLTWSKHGRFQWSNIIKSDGWKWTIRERFWRLNSKAISIDSYVNTKISASKAPTYDKRCANKKNMGNDHITNLNNIRYTFETKRWYQLLKSNVNTH